MSRRRDRLPYNEVFKVKLPLKANGERRLTAIFRPILILSGIVGLMLVLSGCGPAYERRMACKSQVGPEPYAHGDIFGPIGVAIAEAQPERIAYRAAVRRCVEGSTIMGRQ